LWDMYTYFKTSDDLQNDKNKIRVLELSLKTTFGDTKFGKWVWCEFGKLSEL